MLLNQIVTYDLERDENIGERIIDKICGEFKCLKKA